MAQRIGKYRILERIGRGGMGTVYKAHDTVLDRMVALKVISSEIDVSDDLKARFYREARACAQLNHPKLKAALAWRDARSQVSDPHRLAQLYEQRIVKLRSATAQARAQQ